MSGNNEIIKVVGGALFFAGKNYRCAVGKNGFSADKKEGDGCTPIGMFPLRELWYRADKMSAPKTSLPLRIISEDDGWCDDVNSEYYNRHVKLPLTLGEGRGEGNYTNAPAELVEYARKLRKESTAPEKKLWFLLRNRQMNGHKFRRQHPICTYIADFYCDELRLVIELDGESHFTAEGVAHDKIRSHYFQEQGYRIIRFTNAEIRDNFEAVLDNIYNITKHNSLTKYNSLTLPLSQRERELGRALSQKEIGLEGEFYKNERGNGCEKLWRSDDVYDLIIPLGYNDSPIVKGKGSAIFMHVAKADYSGTEGCVALSKDDLLKFLPLLSPQSCIEISPA